WPSTTPSMPISTSMGAETSPVNAPLGRSCMFCANTATPRAASRAAASAVNGAQTATSTPSRGRTAARNSRASACVLCIFQLPAMSGMRVTRAPPCVLALEPASSGISLERDDTGQLATLDELERRSAAGRDVIDAVLEPEPGQRGDAVAAAHDRRRAGARDGFGHRARARGEGLELEGAHRAVPED